jgi:magnesium transporter
MIIKRYDLIEGRLREQAGSKDPLTELPEKPGQTWYEVRDAGAEELRRFLKPLDLHPLQMKRCLDSVITPGVISFEKSLLMEYPAAFDPATMAASYLTILIKENILVTVRHGAMTEFDELVRNWLDPKAPLLLHLPQLLYVILDHFSDLNVESQVAIRDQIMLLSGTVSGKPESVSLAGLSLLRSRIENLASLLENQLYCISGLNACDHEALQDPHRKAYIQDLLSETEIAQRGITRLESRMKDITGDYLAAGNERVEKRLRLLTIVSAITLPLGLVAGLLGMNVGGLPGTTARSGFMVVIVLMVLIVAAEYGYFKRKGWFD